MYISPDLSHLFGAPGVRRWAITRPKVVRQYPQHSASDDCVPSTLLFRTSRILKRLIKGFSNIAAPLNRLLEKNKPFEWTDECMAAYEKLKAMLLQRPVVAYPDFSMPFRLYTDASNVGLGAILTQQQEGKECIVCCASRTFSKSKQNYSATKKCLAMVWEIKNFRNYLIANHFKVYTDHYSLQWLQSMKHESALLHRWAAQLEDYDFEVLHRPGKNQGHVDALTWLPLDNVNLLGADKTTLGTPEATKEVLRQLHE